MNIPANVKLVLEKLNYNGFEAYVVGGCLRDSLLGREPHDWDITTNACTAQIKDVFYNCSFINNNGEKHGTVTVNFNNEFIEITTYRTESAYSDHRHPDEVKFVSSLKEDLARRDFTINAMAADKDGNIIDYFGGQQDLKDKVIRCVGFPDDRFDEDALRILRALRFASRYNFMIETDTLIAMAAKKYLLQKISKERIQSELNQMIVYPAFVRLLTKLSHVVLISVIPELKSMFYFEQRSKYHIHDLWMHTISVMNNVNNNYIEKLAALFHDIGKTECYTEDKQGFRHYVGHAEKSYEMTKVILERLKYSNEDTEKILWLVRNHDFTFSETNPKKSAKKLIASIPENYRDELLEMFFSLRAADRVDHIYSEKTISIEEMKKACKEVLENNECFSLKQLAINGYDIIQLGFKNQKIGQILNDCLKLVVEGKLSNEKEILLNHIKNTYLVEVN